jgi:hypothetical protein
LGYPVAEQSKETDFPSVAVWFCHTRDLYGQQSSLGFPR